ncbi:single-stranded-DNA-specific exonuclease RecJ [Afifella sp. JA880]|uniref:single-stranded-DNA-specific exonuclease RecJ n=1 Tax=Afifella sp. JA880 TaxID=2975280 RepID=UPI0021BAA8D7|nr:single-stranded-DNA-specific exonuclease RecJ [Afifella sp. JA880]MCT8265891.1 single-stranded-DNA-specific exonuclease RecJ [Afifella sp. JA880]
MWGRPESSLDLQTPSFCLGVDASLKGRAWRMRLDARGEAAATALAQRTGLSESICRVLVGRGISDDGAEAFLGPSLKTDMPDPSCLMDMDLASGRLADATERREKVAIFGDYDVDGATSAALLSDTLSGLGVTTEIYIPDRLIEGYGPNPEAIDRLIDAGAQLIVTVDCGATSFEALERAHARGVDVVVIDHHQMGLDRPKAVALVNPNRQDCLSGLGHLAAVGLVFMTAVALLRELRRRRYTGALPDLLSGLDLVALGTICDVVPLTGLNRAFVTKGLVALRHGGRPGLQALAAAARLKGPVETSHCGFLLGPRINAGGRIGDAGLGARLLTTRDAAEAESIAATLERLNAERQAIEAEAVAEACAQADAAITRAGETPSILVVVGETWHPGVVGLVASRLKERFQRPALAITFDGPSGNGTGSARSIAGVDLGAAVRAALAAGLLEKGGGHKMAAGVTVRREKLDELQRFLIAELEAPVETALIDDCMKIDGLITADGASREFFAEIEKCGPYGAGHPSPVFVLPAHRIAYVDTVGNGHIRLDLRSKSGGRIKAMAFREAETPLGRALLSSGGEAMHIAGTLSLNRWGGQEKVEMKLLDAAPA